MKSGERACQHVVTGIAALPNGGKGYRKRRSDKTADLVHSSRPGAR